MRSRWREPGRRGHWTDTCCVFTFLLALLTRLCVHLSVQARSLTGRGARGCAAGSEELCLASDVETASSQARLAPSSADEGSKPHPIFEIQIFEPRRVPPHRLPYPGIFEKGGQASASGRLRQRAFVNLLDSLPVIVHAFSAAPGSGHLSLLVVAAGASIEKAVLGS